MKRLASADRTTRLAKKAKLDRPCFTLSEQHPPAPGSFGAPLLLTHWNINGLRARLRDPEQRLAAYLSSRSFDIVCFNEAKLAQEAFVELEVARNPLFAGYSQYWAFPKQRKGYSGTAVLTRQRPLAVSEGVGAGPFDEEGRALTLEFDRFILVAVYVPNSGGGLVRLEGRVGTWDTALRAHVAALSARKPVLLVGDMNVAHNPIDLARPKSNEGSACYTPEERASFSALLAAGMRDVFRERNPQKVQYTYWCQRMNARASNCGWRLDYCLADEAMERMVREVRLRDDVFGSDHCPVEVEIEL